MKTVTMIVAMLVMLGGLTVLAEDTPARQDAAAGAADCGAKQGGGILEGRAQIMRKAMQWLKEKEPARAEEIMKLRESDQEAFRKAMGDVVKEYLKANPNERPGQGKVVDRMQIMRKAMQWLKEKNPARAEEIMKLRESDQEGFRKAMGDVVKEYLKEHPEEKPQGGDPKRSNPPEEAAAPKA